MLTAKKLNKVHSSSKRSNPISNIQNLNNYIQIFIANKKLAKNTRTGYGTLPEVLIRVNWCLIEEAFRAFQML